MIKILILLGVIVTLLVLAPSLSYAVAISPKVHKCIHDMVEQSMLAAGMVTALSVKTNQTPTNPIESMVDNDTAFVESCLK